VAGLTDLDHDLARCHRTASTLGVAYVDAIGLKRVNDSGGHDAGDRLLKRVVTLIRQHLRAYDLTIRLGGDEFLCAMSNIALSDARERFSALARCAPMTAGYRCLERGFTVSRQCDLRATSQRTAATSRDRARGRAGAASRRR
jgi:diguanylate cyclase (GGDEF)-like protein